MSKPLAAVQVAWIDGGGPTSLLGWVAESKEELLGKGQGAADHRQARGTGPRLNFGSNGGWLIGGGGPTSRRCVSQ